MSDLGAEIGTAIGAGVSAALFGVYKLVEHIRGNVQRETRRDSDRPRKPKAEMTESAIRNVIQEQEERERREARERRVDDTLKVLLRRDETTADLLKRLVETQESQADTAGVMAKAIERLEARTERADARAEAIGNGVNRLEGKMDGVIAAVRRSRSVQNMPPVKAADGG